MRVGQQAFGHAHRQKRDAALFHERTDVVIGLRIGRAFAENDQWALRIFENIKRARHRGRCGNLRRRRVDHLDQRLGAGLRIHHLREQLAGQIEIDAAGATRHGGTDRPRHADADIGGMQYAKGRLAERLGDGELVHLLIVALLQVDDFALRRAADQDHRKAVGRSIGQRRQAVEKSGRRNREADAGLLGQEAGDGGRVAGVLLMAERDDPNARGLRHAAEVGDRNAGHAVNRVDAVELERVDDQVETIGQGPIGVGHFRAVALLLHCCAGHAILRVTRHSPKPFAPNLFVVDYSIIRTPKRADRCRAASAFDTIPAKFARFFRNPSFVQYLPRCRKLLRCTRCFDRSRGSLKPGAGRVIVRHA